MFRILFNRNTNDKYEPLLALIISMTATSSIVEFFEDVEELCETPMEERVAETLRGIVASVEKM